MKFNCSINKELKEQLEREYKEYIRKTPMTRKEQRSLRDWVKSGHSVNENPGSKYLCDSYPPLDYLDVYRQDAEIEQALKGKSKAECEAYLKQYMGYDDPEEARTPKKSPKEHIRNLEHELFYLWEFICSEGMWQEARDYLEEHEDDDILFGYEE